MSIVCSSFLKLPWQPSNTMRVGLKINFFHRILLLLLFAHVSQFVAVMVQPICFSFFCFVFLLLVSFPFFSYCLNIITFLQGMQYLHRVDIKFHGHLTSCNCVVDSRWVLKITDHGLREFKSPNEQRLSVRGGDYQVNYQSMLWNYFNLLKNRNCYHKIESNWSTYCL